MSIKNKHFGPLHFYSEALRIAIPVMLQQLIMSLVSLIDNFMVAGLGDISMAAVNMSNHIMFIFIVLMNTSCAAGGIYLSQFRGAENQEGMKHSYRFKAIMALCGASLFMILFWTIPELMLQLMIAGNASQDDIIFTGTGYLHLVSFTLVPMAISIAIGTSFREIGKPRVPLVISVCATVINTFGNWILIYGNLGAPRLEVTGAAIATIIARTFEATVFIVYVNKTKASFYCPFRLLRFIELSLVWKILSKSMMIFISDFSWIASETVMLAMYNSRGGAETVAGMAAGWTIANIFFLFFGGIWTASVVLVGGSLGADRLDEARKRAKWIISGSVLFGVILSVIGVFLTFLIVPLVYSNLSAEARSICMGLVFVILAYLPLWTLINAHFSICRAGGDMLLGLYADGFVNCLILIPGAIVLGRLTTIGPVAMFAVLKLTDVIKIFITNYFYKSERWVKNLTVI